jgi:hypothetical protein
MNASFVVCSPPRHNLADADQLGFETDPYPRMDPQLTLDELTYRPDGRLTVSPRNTLGGVAAFLNGWTLVGVPFLLFGIAALLGAVAALLAGCTFVGVTSVLLGIAALLGGVALLYGPELPQRLVEWLTKRDNLTLAADGEVRD